MARYYRTVSVLPFYLSLLFPLGVLNGYRMGGWLTFSVVLVAFVAIPLLDPLLGRRESNPTEEECERGERQWRWRWPLYLFVIEEYLLLALAMGWMIHQDLSALEWIGLTVSTGVITGAIGITIAHELIHRRHPGERALGELLLINVCYHHFTVEHVAGHHQNVATPKDPATARKGESFYRFYLRTVVGSFRSAWKLEKRRLQRQGLSPIRWNNRVLYGLIAQGILLISLSLGFGWQAGVFFLAQSWIAFSLLELVNYVEHYGLERKEIAPGKFEKVGPQHSWDASNRLTNWFLFHLQRHADHHRYPTRRFQSLRLMDGSPRLPTGYAGMLLLAVVPPLWRRVMHPRLQALADASAG